jgi:hypothetical protein
VSLLYVSIYALSLYSHDIVHSSLSGMIGMEITIAMQKEKEKFSFGLVHPQLLISFVSPSHSHPSTSSDSLIPERDKPARRWRSAETSTRGLEVGHREIDFLIRDPSQSIRKRRLGYTCITIIHRSD